MPDEIQPLNSAQLVTADHIAAHARNTVKNVLDSYTGRFDVLVESVQNAMDALEKRWGANVSFGDEVPRLTVHLDADAETISVTDNGTGIEPSNLLSALVPHMSPKSLDPSPTRGHKGVGTTFLAYGHPHFEIRTKVFGGTEIAYRILGGLAWARSLKVAEPPKFERSVGADELSDYQSGTRVVIGVGEESRFGRLKNAQYNKLDTWALVLRTFTAIGHMAVGVPEHKLPAWLTHLRVELQLSGVAGAGSANVPVGFFLPHTDTASKITLQQLGSGGVPQNSRYELLYTELDNSALELALAAQLQELADSDQPEDQEILNAFRAYDTAVYASWAYKNTWYEDLYRSRIGEDAKRYQYNNVRSGLLISSVGMPIGEVNDHPYVTMKPEYKRRMFVVASFNEKYSPDLGRKTIPSADRALLNWLELQLQNLFLKQVSRLVKANDDAPHNAGSYEEAKEQLANQVEVLRKKYESRHLIGAGLGFERAPAFESELVGIFTSLVATGRLRGYNLLAIPGSATRYDGLFDFVTSEFASANADGYQLDISEAKASGGLLQRKGKWLEFKLRLEDLVDNFAADDGDPSKKYFDLLDLAVVWAVPSQDAVGDYDLHRFDGQTWTERNYFGATHRLSATSGNHKVEVISVQDLLSSLAPNVS